MTIPYADTEVPASRSRGDIDVLLKKIGAIAIQWTDTTASIRGEECPTLQFAVSRTLDGAEQRFIVRLKAPMLKVPRGRGFNKSYLPNLNASMRLLYWYVKTKAEAMEYGLEDVVEAFMPNILISLPDGSTSTMAQALKNKPQALSQVFALPSEEVLK
jgi:hypothetical protein